MEFRKSFSNCKRTKLTDNQSKLTDNRIYASLIEKLLENTSEIKGKLREKIEANKEKGILSKKLATIMLDVPIEYDFVDFKLDSPNHENVYEIFEELEFARMKENFKRIFIEEKQENLVKEQARR